MNPIEHITPLDKKTYSLCYNIMYDYIGKEALFSSIYMSSVSNEGMWTGIRKVMHEHSVAIEIDESTRNVKITVILNNHE